MGLGDSVLDNVAATFFHTDSPAVTKIRGIIRSAVNTGAGSWFVTLTEALPIGEYLGAALNLTFASPVECNVYDGDATHKFLIFRVGGIPADVNGIGAWWSRAFNNGAGGA